MSRVHSHISSAVKIIEKYQGAQPLAIFLKTFFSSQKKYGSRDRKAIAGLCYAYYRTGRTMPNETIAAKILTGLFLTENTPNEFLQIMRPQWNEKIQLPVSEKIKITAFPANDLIPFVHEISEKIDKENYASSFLEQPRLFLRARPGKHAVVLQNLNDAGILYQTIGNDCISLPPGTKADGFLKINHEVVIQDMNSQRVLNYLDALPINKNIKSHAWDCCAASGGKSILLYDRLQGNVRLTVSDIREGILSNLRSRLEDAGISINKSFIADLENKPETEDFDIIICDAPCTGSGTWSRTPEQLYYFHTKKIAEYAALQKKIISNTIPALKSGGLYFYITCSVFIEENEKQVQFIQEEFGLELLQEQYLAGYRQQADTMFVSVFQKA